MIKKYLDAFPYSYTYISKDSQYIFYLMHSHESKKLMALDLSKSLDRSDAVQISEEDFSKRSFRPIAYHTETNLFYFLSDQANQENFNIYSIDLATKAIKQVTDTSYCGVYGFCKDYQLLAYGDRYQKLDGKFYTRLYLMDLASGTIELLADDKEWEYRLGWSNVIFDDAKENIFLSVDKDNARLKANLIKINLSSKEIAKLLPANIECPIIFTIGKLCENNNLYFCSQGDGFLNYYHCDLHSKVVTQLTFFTKSNTGFHFSNDNRTLYTTLTDKENDQTLYTKITLNSSRAPETIFHALMGSHSIVPGDDIWISCSNMDVPLTLFQYQFSNELRIKRELPNYIGTKESLVHNTYNYVEYESFDGKIIPSFISLPESKIKGAIVTAFYGGSNHYSWQTQLFAELGFVHLSPSVRGSWTEGLEWQNLIKGDLGGNEILDVHWGCRFLEKEFGLSPKQIGVEGGSHGGYSVLRAMTMPEGFKDVKGSSYPYGFGICWAGFADLEDFYRTSNIPDWLVNMLGPYEGNEEKYRERSPIHYFENLRSPLFISHGTNDSRVSATSMEGFINKLKKSDKPYVLHLMDGLGHGTGNKNEELILYEKLVSFLKNTALTT